MEGAIEKAPEGELSWNDNAGAQAAVRQPSTTASGRGDARQGGHSFAILPPGGFVVCWACSVAWG
jgi:hypothetical protein